MELRAYQKDLINEASEQFRHSRSVLMVLPTGGGKTAVAGEISRRMAKRHSDRKCIALYLVHRAELLDQTVKTLSKFGLGEMVGTIARDMPEVRWMPLQVGMIQTVVKRMERMDWLNPMVIFIDEAHHARAATWEKVLNHFPKARRIGLTATPARLDNKGLGKFFESMCEGPGIRELIEEGYLADYKVFAPPPTIDMRKMNKKKQDEAVTGPVISSSIKAFERHAKNRRVIHFAVSVRHSHEFVRQLRGIGIKAEHVDGETPGNLRAEIMRRFEEGITQVVSNVDLATEGVDFPECDCIIIAKYTTSLTRYRQMVGRALRPKEDGREALILDLCGVVSELGEPDEAIKWSLDDGWIEEKEKNTGPPRFKTCPNCEFLFPSSQTSCPFCGYELPTVMPVELDIELTESGGENKRRYKNKQRELSKEIIATGGNLEKLHEVRRKYQYHPKVVERWLKAYQFAWSGRR